MASSRLPVELTDRIIDFCHSDKGTLSNCALTHSSWLAASRYHLFHTITRTGVQESVGPGTPSKAATRNTSFNLSHWHAPIVPYIRTVKIESLVNVNRTLRLRNATHLADAIRQFCNRESLPVPSVHVTMSLLLGPSDALWPSQVSDMVTHVKLLNVTFSHPNDIWPFLSLFRQLQHLELESVGFSNSAQSNLPAERMFDGVPLSTIRMATASMGFVISSLIRVAGSLTHLDEFGIAYQDIRQGALPQLAEGIQRGVKCLRFSASCYPGDERNIEWRPSAFDISEHATPTPTIRTLTIRMPDRNPEICWDISVT
jgi:hypothetical protein